MIPGGQIISGEGAIGGAGTVQRPHGQLFDTPSSGDPNTWSSSKKRGKFLDSAQNRDYLRQTLNLAGKIFGSNQEEEESMGGGVTSTGKGFGGGGATIPGVGAVMTPGEHAPFTVAGMKGSPGWGGAVGKLAGGIIGNVIAPGVGGGIGSQIGETVGGIV